MKIVTDKKTCQSAIKSAAKLANKGGTMRILECLAVSFDGETVTVTANDLERTYTETFPATGDPGQCSIPAKKLVSVVNAAKGAITITDELVKSGRSRVKLDSLPYGDFPQPDYYNGDAVGVDGLALGKAIGSVIHAMPIKDARYMFNGIHITSGHAVATDGKRMAVADVGYSGIDIIIPAESARQMMELCGDVRVSEKQLIIDGPGYRFSTSLVDAKYPDWNRIMPKNLSESVTVNSAELLESCKIVELGDEKFKNAKLVISDGVLTVSNSGAESGCDCEHEGDIEIGLNLPYLIDAINAEGGELTIIRFSNGGQGAAKVGEFNILAPVRL